MAVGAYGLSFGAAAVTAGLSTLQACVLSLLLFTGASQFTQPIAPIAAAAVVVTVPIVIIVLLFQRKIVAGLTSGAVKG